MLLLTVDDFTVNRAHFQGDPMCLVAMQHLRGQTVTVVNMLQFVVAGVFGYFLYQEVPNGVFYLSTSLLLIAMALVIFNQRQF